MGWTATVDHASHVPCGIITNSEGVAARLQQAGKHLTSRKREGSRDTLWPIGWWVPRKPSP